MGSYIPEVLGGLGDRLAIQSHNNATHILVAMLDVKVHLVRDLGSLAGLDSVG